VKSLATSYDIIMLQELMLMKDDAGILSNIDNNYFAYYFLKDKIVSDVNIGRPTKGVAFLINKTLKDSVTPLFINESIIALVLNGEFQKYLLINVYMPVDRQNCDSFDEFQTELALISSLIEEHNIHNVILAGDFNANLNKINRWREQSSFCEQYSLNFTDSKLPPDSFTYLSPGNDTVSWLDHVVCSAHLNDLIYELEILHDFSIYDHFPIAFNLSVVLKMNVLLDESQDRSNCTFDTSTFIKWDKLKCEEIVAYQKIINDKLDQFNFSSYDCFNCYDLNCTSKSHRTQLTSLFKFLLYTIRSASTKLGEQKVNSSKFKIVPGWNDLVKDAYRNSRRNFFAWLNADKPRYGPLLDSMKASRLEFKKVYRKCKTNEESIRNDKMSNALKSKDDKIFWKYVRSTNVTTKQSAIRIDKESNPVKIAEIFSNKFKKIFDDIECQSKYVPKITSREKLCELRYFSPLQIESAINSLNPQIDHDNIHSNHLKHSPRSMSSFLSKFFSICYRHSYVPDDLVKGILLPLTKDKHGDRESSNNYRPIISSSVFLKTLEYAIKLKIEHLLCTNERQFGFKSHSSTQYATLVLKEVINTYTTQNSNVYLSFLDVSKAFDKVSHCKLLQALERRGVDNNIINLINHWYSCQEIHVNFENCNSQSWYIKNGVRQGGVLSPYLFVLYIDCVLDKISRMKVGCRLQFLMLNNIVFADDFVILAPTLGALQKILNVINSEFKSLNLKLNPDKCVCMKINKKGSPKDNLHTEDLFLNDIKLKYVKEYKYLGFIITNNLSNKNDIIRARNKFYNVFNMLLRKFHYVNVDTFLTLFESYCKKIYGADLWFGDKDCKTELKKFGVGYHKALKKICCCPYYFSNHFVCNNINTLTFQHYLKWIKIRFSLRVLKSKNKLFVKLSDYMLNHSTLAQSLLGILRIYNIEDPLLNDKDAILARIFYVQRHEQHSNAFDFINNL
jgi:hypothetical protein